MNNMGGHVGGTAFHTDHYELTNLQAAFESGVAGQRAVFELFARGLPDGRRYGVFGGLGRVIEAIQEFRFDDDKIRWLEANKVGNHRLWEYLANYSFTGDVQAYREGEIYFPYSPVLTVDATFAEGVVLETLLLSMLNWDTGIASTASRMVTAAQGRPLLEFGSRRVHESAAVAAARAAYAAGFSATSNLMASAQYGIPSKGTAAHCFVLAHKEESEAFRAQVAALGPDTVFLVDTYDTPTGVRNAVEAAGPGASAGVRIDSGDPMVEVPRARALLDSMGARGWTILISNEIDEHKVEALVSAGVPVDSFGIGTRLMYPEGVTPSPGLVYKLVAISDSPGAPLRNVAKKSAGKPSVGGKKTAYRALNDDGYATAERVVVRRVAGGGDESLGRPLQVDVFKGGEVTHDPSLDEIREFHQCAKGELLPLEARLDYGAPAFSGAPRPELGIGF